MGKIEAKSYVRRGFCTEVEAWDIVAVHLEYLRGLETTRRSARVSVYDFEDCHRVDGVGSFSEPSLRTLETICMHRQSPPGILLYYPLNISTGSAIRPQGRIT